MSTLNVARRDPLLAAMTVIAMVVLAVITLPLIVAAVTAFNSTTEVAFPPNGWSLKWFENIFKQPDFVRAFWFSLGLACATTVLSLILGSISALALSRLRFPGRDAIDAFLMSPLIVPQVILGLSYLILFVRIGSSDAFLNLLLLHLTITFPYGLRVIRSALSRVDPKLEEAAVGLGASRLKSVVLVTLPQIRPALIVAAFFCFVISFDNFTASAFVTITGATLPIKMFFYIESSMDPTISAISALLIISTSLFVFVADRLIGIDKVV